MKVFDIVSENKDLPKGNPVAKNMNKFNKPATYTDRKKAMKKGDRKHKGAPIDEAPVGAIKQMARKAGARALGRLGAKKTAAGLSGKAETGDVARKLDQQLANYAGKTGLNLKQLDASDLAAFLKSQGYSTASIANLSGVLTPKQIDQALLKAAQEKAKASGATAGTGVQGNTAAAGGGLGAKIAGATGGPGVASKSGTAKPGAAPDSTVAKQIEAVKAKIQKLDAKQKQELIGLL